MNNHLYSIQSIQIILNLALHCIDFNEKQIFKLQSSEAALEKLKCILAEVTTKLGDISIEKESIHKVKSSISDYNRKQEEALEKTVISLQEFLTEDPESEHERIESNPIRSHEWAVLCKDAVQNGCIIDRNNLQVHTAWIIFLRNLKNYYLYKELSIESVWLAFMGELLRLGQRQSVEVIHNFMHLISKSSSHQAHNEMSLRALSALIGICLVDGLELTGLIADPKTMDVFSSPSALHDEYHFMGEVAESLLMNPIFQNPFANEAYQKHHQPNDEFQQELTSLQSMLWHDSVKARLTISSAHSTPTDIESLINSLKSLHLEASPDDEKTPKLKSPREIKDMPVDSPRKAESKVKSPQQSPRHEEAVHKPKRMMRRHASVPSQGSKPEEEKKDEAISRARAISQSISTTPYFLAKQASSEKESTPTTSANPVLEDKKRKPGKGQH